ncbi:putative glutamine synthetase [Helianthus debilis subsp. tardiflorus]
MFLWTGRLLFDDAKGVGEVLNETICAVDDCRGFCSFTICTGRDDRHFVWWLVMCDAYTPAGKPIPTNKRCAAGKIFSNPEVEKEGPYYCGIGTDKAFSHDIVDAHNKACLYCLRRSNYGDEIPVMVNRVSSPHHFCFNTSMSEITTLNPPTPFAKPFQNNLLVCSKYYLFSKVQCKLFLFSYLDLEKLFYALYN